MLVLLRSNNKLKVENLSSLESADIRYSITSKISAKLNFALNIIRVG